MLEMLTQTWEHRVEQCESFDELNRALAQCGDEGWELVSVVQDATPDPSTPLKTRRERRHSAWYAFFKRPMQASDA